MSLSKKAFEIAKSSFGDLIVGFAFGKFSNLIPVTRVKENNYVIAFWHPRPFWDKHIVIVPKKAIKNITSLSEGDSPYIASVFTTASEIVKELGWDQRGYSILINGGDKQKVKQIHFHLHTDDE